MRRLPAFVLAAGLVAGCVDGETPQEPVVPPREVVSLRVAPSQATLLVGQSLLLAAVARDEWGAVVPGAAVEWSTSDPEVIAVSAGGTATALALGTARVDVQCGRLWAGVTIEVEQDTADQYPGLAWTPALQAEQDVGLEAVWVAPSGEAFAVGGRGGWWEPDAVIFRNDGGVWRSMDVPELAVLTGIWGSSADDVYAVGDGMLHYDGAAWGEVVLPGSYFLRHIWGSSPGDVFAVGSSATILHYDGVAWAVMPVSPADSGSLYGVWGSGPEDVFAVGAGGRIMHYDGRAWRPQASPTSMTLSAVWGTSAANVIAVGSEGVMLRYDGVSWSRLPRLTRHPLNGVWGSAADDVYAVGHAGVWPSSYGLDLLHFDGSAWTPWRVPAMSAAGSVGGSPAGDVYLVGATPPVLHGRPVRPGG